MHEVIGQESYAQHRHSGTKADRGYILIHASLIANRKKKEHGESCPDILNFCSDSEMIAVVSCHSVLSSSAVFFSLRDYEASQTEYLLYCKRNIIKGICFLL